MLLWRWRGQACAGLGELRTPAVRCWLVGCGRLSWRCCDSAPSGMVTPSVLESYWMIVVMCVKWRV